jgi:hypothetical protein
MLKKLILIDLLTEGQNSILYSTIPAQLLSSRKGELPVVRQNFLLDRRAVVPFGNQENES